MTAQSDSNYYLRTCNQVHHTAHSTHCKRPLQQQTKTEQGPAAASGAATDTNTARHHMATSSHLGDTLGRGPRRAWP
jgi:hypothetical protein